MERGICNNKIAGEICDFHRNTVFKLLRTKNILGLEAACRDARGHKEPYKYINDTRTSIKMLINTHKDWSDQQIAGRTSADLGMEISRSAVGSIRTGTEEQESRPVIN